VVGTIWDGNRTRSLKQVVQHNMHKHMHMHNHCHRAHHQPAKQGMTARCSSSSTKPSNHLLNSLRAGHQATNAASSTERPLTAVPRLLSVPLAVLVAAALAAAVLLLVALAAAAVAPLPGFCALLAAVPAATAAAAAGVITADVIAAAGAHLSRGNMAV
jgi:hypothetical protein